MNFKTLLSGWFKGQAARPFSKVALEPVTDLPHAPQPAVNPMLLRGLYRDQTHQ